MVEPIVSIKDVADFRGAALDSRVQPPRQVGVELLVLVLAAVLPAATYVGGLGFYSDDWHFLAELSATRGLQAAVNALASDLLARPPQLLLMSMEFDWFALSPLGYHSFSIGLLAAAVVGLYFTLVEFEVPRYLAFGAAAVYATLPHYSTDRFWLAAQQADIAAAFFFAGTYAISRALRPSARWRAWLGAGALSISVSLLAYEVFVGMAALALPAAVLFRARDGRIGRKKTVQIVGVVLLVVMGVVVYKAATTSSRVPEFPSLIARLRWFAAVLRDGTIVSYGMLGIGQPVAAAAAFVRRPDAARGLVALALGFLLSMVSFRLCSGGWTQVRPRHWLSFTVAGVLMFVGGLAIFLTSTAFAGTASGPSNRTLIASAAGVAVTLTAVAGWLVARLDGVRRRAVAFSACIGVFAASGMLINTTTADYWVDAAQQQAAILRGVATVAPRLPADATLILAGTCPYSGPGIVFDAPWDLTGALQIALGRPDLRADVATSRLQGSDAGVTTQIFGVPSFYPYRNLFGFDARSGTLVSIPDRASLEGFLQGTDPATLERCQAAQPGIGEAAF